MMARLNLDPGIRYTRLVAEKRIVKTKNGTRVTYWDCLCDCGNRKTVSQKDLRCGHTKSCGCLRLDLNRKRFETDNPVKGIPQRIDLTGEIVGRLRVVKFFGIRVSPGGAKRALWECICQCGNTYVTSAYSLMAPRVYSCGCAYAEEVKHRQYLKRTLGIPIRQQMAAKRANKG